MMVESRADTDVRDVIAAAYRRAAWLLSPGEEPPGFIADAVLAALAEAGLVVVPAEDVAELEDLSEKATDGPWREYPIGSEGSLISAGGNTIRTHRRIGNTYEFDDATFAVAAVNFVRELIASRAALSAAEETREDEQR